MLQGLIQRATNRVIALESPPPTAEDKKQAAALMDKYNELLSGLSSLRASLEGDRYPYEYPVLYELIGNQAYVPEVGSTKKGTALVCFPNSLYNLWE